MQQHMDFAPTMQSFSASFKLKVYIQSTVLAYTVSGTSAKFTMMQPHDAAMHASDTWPVLTLCSVQWWSERAVCDHQTVYGHMTCPYYTAMTTSQCTMCYDDDGVRVVKWLNELRVKVVKECYTYKPFFLTNSLPTPSAPPTHLRVCTHYSYKHSSSSLIDVC